MATNAERQRAWRYRNLKEGTMERLNIGISVQAKRQLQRLDRYNGCTQRVILENLLAEAERKAVEHLEPGEQKAYYSGQNVTA